MAEEPSPFDPNAMAPAKPGEPALVDKWKNFLSDPNTAATIMSFGASLAAPMGFGATRAGHISQAVGHAAKTATNRDALDRKDRETDSKIDAREAAADAATRRAQVAEANSNTAAVRAQAANQSASINDELRRTKMDTERSRQEEISAKVRLLELKAALYPEDQEIRQQLMMARAGYLGARTADIPANAQVRQQNADTRANDSTTRQRGMEGRLAVDAERLNVQQREGAANRQSREGVAAGRQSGADRAAYDRYASDPLRVGPAVSFEEWKAKRGGGTGAPTAPQTPAPRVPPPSQPSRPQTQPAGGSSPPMQGARQAPNGKWYVERDGRYFEVRP